MKDWRRRAAEAAAEARRAAEEARHLTDTYGLAYMAAKNVIGPVSILVFYAALRYGVDVQGGLDWLAGGGAGAGSSRRRTPR